MPGLTFFDSPITCLGLCVFGLSTCGKCNQLPALVGFFLLQSMLHCGMSVGLFIWVGVVAVQALIRVDRSVVYNIVHALLEKHMRSKPAVSVVCCQFLESAEYYGL